MRLHGREAPPAPSYTHSGRPPGPGRGSAATVVRTLPFNPTDVLAAYIVEDNADIRDGLASALEELTCVRVIGGSGTEQGALQWMASHEEWDILLVDLFLQGGSGMRLVQQLRRARPGQKIVVFSNYVNASVRKRCAQLGVDAVFDKSTEIDALLDYCAHLCAQRAALAAARAPASGLA